MKLYLFFQFRNNTGKLDQPILYAYTDKKKHMKKFIETRNMDYFYLKEVKMSDKEFLHFQDKHQSYMLSDFSFLTRMIELPTFTQHIKIVATIGEGQRVYSLADGIFNIMGENGLDPSVYRLKKKYQKTLSEMSYFAIMNWYAKDELPFEISSMDIFNDLDCRVDAFQIFLYFYGYTMKG